MLDAKVMDFSYEGGDDKEMIEKVFELGTRFRRGVDARLSVEL